MRRLIQFLINNVFYIIFLILSIISFALIVNFNNFQKSVYLTSASRMMGGMNVLTSLTTEYFALHGKNEYLSLTNANLLNEVHLLQKELENYRGEAISTVISDTPYRFFSAKVINNSTDKLRNYLTLNKGAKDGVRVDMGVVSDQGVVGIVSSVSEHFSLVISVLNPKIKISSKFKRNNYVGSIVWDGVDYHYVKMEDILEHVPFAVGDTVVTTGFSSVFPENIPVGVVERFEKRAGSTYYDIDVRLFTDFKKLSYVRIIDYRYKKERAELEESVQ